MGVAQAVEDELMGEEKEGEQAGYTNKGSSLIGWNRSNQDGSESSNSGLQYTKSKIQPGQRDKAQPNTSRWSSSQFSKPNPGRPRWLWWGGKAKVHTGASRRTGWGVSNNSLTIMKRRANGLCFKCGDKFHPLLLWPEKQLWPWLLVVDKKGGSGSKYWCQVGRGTSV